MFSRFSRSSPEKVKTAEDEKARLDQDPDIQHEATRIANIRLDAEYVPSVTSWQPSSSDAPRLRIEDNPFTLQVGTGGHRVTAVTQRLLAEIGGVAGLRKFTDAFYQLAFRDPHIDKFIREHKDPHGERFANWIAEKFGDPSQPWSREIRNRPTCPFSSHGRQFRTPHDRSSSHYAAWHSPKRPPQDFGRHFKLDDARVWMRLHFWALRSTGAFERSPAFCAYYVKFIGHFVSIYERTATQFARESCRWSADTANIAAYLANQRHMRDVIKVPYSTALRDLPPSEANDHNWPYPSRY